MQIIKCQRCNKEIENKWGNRKYCHKCRQVVDKELRQKK